MTATPAERRMQAQAAIHTRWAKTAHPADRRDATAPAREAALQRLEDEADPKHQLDPARRRDAALQLQRAKLIEMNRKRSRNARRRQEKQRAGA